MKIYIKYKNTIKYRIYFFFGEKSNNELQCKIYHKLNICKVGKS